MLLYNDIVKDGDKVLRTKRMNKTKIRAYPDPVFVLQVVHP